MDKYYKYRVAAYVTFFTGLLVFWGGLLVSLYHVSAVGTVISIVVGGLLFLATLLLGGKGWSVFPQPERRMLFDDNQREIHGDHLVRGYGAMNPEEPPLQESRKLHPISEEEEKPPAPPE